VVVVLTVYAVALVLFGHLAARHQGALEIGFRALFPTLYDPALTRPVNGYGAGALCGAAALIAFSKSRRKAP
jgi:hypothetical protein